MTKSQLDNLDLTPAGSGTSVKLPRRSGPLNNVASLREALGDVDNLSRLDLPEVYPAALEIGQMIRRIRTAQGMTQISLAQAAGISQAALSDIELGKGSDGPSYRILREIAGALKVELFQKELIGGHLDIKPDPAEVLEITAGARDYVAFDPSIDGLIKVLFDRKEMSDVSVRLQKLIKKISLVRAADDYKCTMLRVEPRARMRVSTHAPAVFVILNGALKVSGRSSFETMKQGYIVPGNKTLDVVNPSKSPSSFMSVPAGCFLSVAAFE